MSVSDGKNGLMSGVGNTPFMGPNHIEEILHDTHHFNHRQADKLHA